MNITKEYLEQRIKECQMAKEQYIANATANDGAVNILKVLLADLEKEEETKDE